MEAVKAAFPYGRVFVNVVDGGLRASSGISIADLGALSLCVLATNERLDAAVATPSCGMCVAECASPARQRACRMLHQARSDKPPVQMFPV